MHTLLYCSHASRILPRRTPRSSGHHAIAFRSMYSAVMRDAAQLERYASILKENG